MIFKDNFGGVGELSEVLLEARVFFAYIVAAQIGGAVNKLGVSGFGEDGIFISYELRYEGTLARA